MPMSADRVRLREIVSADLPMLMQERNEPSTRRYLEDNRPIASLAQQQAWFDGLARDAARLYRIAAIDGEDVGLTRITGLDPVGLKQATVGLDIFARHRGRGFGRAVFEACEALAIASGATQSLLAWVFLENARAFAIYSSCGYRCREDVAAKWFYREGAMKAYVLLERRP